MTMPVNISQQFLLIKTARRGDHDRTRRRVRRIWLAGPDASWLLPLLFLVLASRGVTVEATPSYLVTLPLRSENHEECFDFRVPGDRPFMIRYVDHLR
jgi:hypothetical protein